MTASIDGYKIVLFVPATCVSVRNSSPVSSDTLCGVVGAGFDFGVGGDIMKASDVDCREAEIFLLISDTLCDDVDGGCVDSVKFGVGDHINILRLELDQYVEEATYIVFKVDSVYILSD